MDARELRIGNICMREPVLDSKRQNKPWNQIVVGCNDIVACTVNPNSFKPIPLTEDWLLKFGFELLCRKSPNGYKETVFSMKKPCWTLMQLDKGWGVQFWQGNKLEYVNQLQNLYFALTGKELELKTQQP